MSKRESEEVGAQAEAKKPRVEDNGWTPDSWRTFPIKQQPKYASSDKLAEVCAKLSQVNTANRLKLHQPCCRPSLQRLAQTSRLHPLVSAALIVVAAHCWLPVDSSAHHKPA